MQLQSIPANRKQIHLNRTAWQQKTQSHVQVNYAMQASGNDENLKLQLADLVLCLSG